jgi:biofilm PGA synthesis lipoprotein PgaB
MPHSSTPRRATVAAPRRKRLKRRPRRSIMPTLLVIALFCLLFVGAAVTASFFAPHSRTQSPTVPAAATDAGVTPAIVPVGLANPQAKVSIVSLRRDGVPMILITGGIAGTRRYVHREGVSQFVRGCGATAGLNGTFFANASLNGTDNLLIGPSLCGNEQQLTRGPFDHRAPLTGRPLVLISPTYTRLIAYDPQTMDDDGDIRTLLPGVTDVFLGGVWLVHNGVAADASRMAAYKVTDDNDPRRRAFFGVMSDGRPVLGATTYVTSSLHLARALQDSGLQEAVLLDSGFSTSLVWHNHILVTGHTSPGIPSRPVPHAIVLFGQSDLARSKPNFPTSPA